MKMLLKKVVYRTSFERMLGYVLNRKRIRFNSLSYWENRYSQNGNSGAGSYGRLAIFKASFLNNFVKNNNINSIIEFGCGDGNQLSLAKYPSYIGYDVSKTAISICQKKFKSDSNMAFKHIDDEIGGAADLTLSLDVVFHLIEEKTYEEYMRRLFSSSKKFVIIYSSNYENKHTNAVHVKHRRFTDYVEKNIEQFELIETFKNIYPYSKLSPEQTSFSDFYVFKKT